MVLGFRSEVGRGRDRVGVSCYGFCEGQGPLDAWYTCVCPHKDSCANMRVCASEFVGKVWALN